jgi:hypothetical protein
MGCELLATRIICEAFRLAFIQLLASMIKGVLIEDNNAGVRSCIKQRIEWNRGSHGWLAPKRSFLGWCSDFSSCCLQLACLCTSPFPLHKISSIFLVN